MTEASPEDAAAQRAAEQARLRKERREAKIRAGGTSRLNKITGLGGRAPTEEAPAATSSATSAVPSPSLGASPAPKTTSDHADPEEVDISQHFYQPAATARAQDAAAGTPPLDPNGLSEAQLRQMMLGFERGPPGSGPQGQGQSGTPPPFNPFAAMGGGGAGGAPGEEDPMMKMLSQMMAAGGPGGANGGGAGGMPPGMEALAGGFPGMMPPGGAGVAKPASAALSTWRIVHAIFALALGFYITFTTHFSGSKAQRERAALALDYDHHLQRDGVDEAFGDVGSPAGAASAHAVADAMQEGRAVFFWMFATAEALLITTRLMVERGKPAAEAGLVWNLVAFLPGPWKGRVETVMRYGQVFSSVRRDILVCVFVLGVASWWRG